MKLINNNKKTQADYAKKHMEQFEGSYIYMIIDKRTKRTIYVGETGNVVRRYYNHYNMPSLSSGLAYWCKENGQDLKNYEMVVLDLTEQEELDYDDRLLIERVLQYYHKETIYNKQIPKKLEVYEIERFDYIGGIMDFDFRPYREVKVLKMSNKKVLGLQTEELDGNCFGIN